MAVAQRQSEIALDTGVEPSDARIERHGKAARGRVIEHPRVGQHARVGRQSDSSPEKSELRRANAEPSRQRLHRLLLDVVRELGQLLLDLAQLLCEGR